MKRDKGFHFRSRKPLKSWQTNGSEVNLSLKKWCRKRDLNPIPS